MSGNKLSHAYKIIVIAGSAGSFQGITKILASLSENIQIPIVLCLHRLKHVKHGFAEALEIKSTNPVVEPYDKQPIRRGHVYLAPANYHLAVDFGHSFSIATDEMVNNSRPSIDIMMESASFVFKENMIAILLSGANNDGALGMKKVKERGGFTIVQDPSDCSIDTMPSAAMKASKIDRVLNIDQIVDFLNQMESKVGTP